MLLTENFRPMPLEKALTENQKRLMESKKPLKSSCGDSWVWLERQTLVRTSRRASWPNDD